ncbi:ATP-binding protein [Limimaricola variabilis]|uniref:ATP-binding protein n=1 Tax=Limimaricola variabilis TaxID=1492771 RepID=UPI002AC914B7|nr:ATP-binding protein [Limimaricola variabilis]WPY94704.1 ATP-binding protein [Limimaricola variabilis]
MPEESMGSAQVAPLKNVAALAELIDRVANRPIGLPGLGVLYGPSGFGKSMAAIYCTNRFHAVTVQIKSVWTRKKLCEAILAEMGIPKASTVSDMLDQISEQLAISDVPLIIDEADFLVQRKMIEIIRDIYEGSQAPVILIGEELLPQKLREWERVHNRVLDWVPAEPADMSDVAHLTRLYASGVEVTKELQERLLRESHASIRRICVNLTRIAELARREGLETVGLDQWGKRPFFTGAAPEVRRFGDASARRAG